MNFRPTQKCHKHRNSDDMFCYENQQENENLEGGECTIKLQSNVVEAGSKILSTLFSKSSRLSHNSTELLLIFARKKLQSKRKRDENLKARESLPRTWHSHESNRQRYNKLKCPTCRNRSTVDLTTISSRSPLLRCLFFSSFFPSLLVLSIGASQSYFDSLLITLTKAPFSFLSFWFSHFSCSIACNIKVIKY